MIEFLCPNGHRIRCHAEQAGRAAKCPRCGVKFRVPDAADLDIPEANDSDPNVSRPEFTDSGFKGETLSSTGGGIKKEPQIEFLCPNGHRLFGPASLQGKPGECPECGSRFRIPTYDEGPDEKQSKVKDGESGNARTAPAIDDAPTTISRSTPTDRSMASVFARLWKLRPKGSTVELRLRDGETIVPHQFLDKASRENRSGVFLVKEEGKLSVVAVAWDAVVRVSVRGLKELPPELADGHV
ncbi:MAG: hypothetical protein JW959_14965 [Pirellulales bacterium]|nr:hypothetical protein [Pirellulales bacterium]